MLPFAAFHMGLHYLPKYLFICIQNEKLLYMVFGMGEILEIQKLKILNSEIILRTFSQVEITPMSHYDHSPVI